jgi:hypothetical protein
MACREMVPNTFLVYPERHSLPLLRCRLPLSKSDKCSKVG